MNAITSVKGWVFVIPNKVVKIDWNVQHIIERSRGYFLDHNQSIYDSLEGVPECEMTEGEYNGKKYSYPAQWIQIWAQDLEEKSSNPAPERTGSYNFGRHGFYYNGEYYRCGFPDYLPASLFTGKKEGDKISFKLNDIPFELELAQGKGRYRRFGKFEEIFEKMIS